MVNPRPVLSSWSRRLLKRQSTLEPSWIAANQCFVHMGSSASWQSTHETISCLRLHQNSTLPRIAVRSFQTVPPRQAPHSSKSNNDQQPNRSPPSDDSTANDKTTSFQTSDPPVLTWVDQYLPISWQPYARLARIDKPIGTWLLLWPCGWSTALAATPGTLPDVSLLALFGLGALTMRGAGCTINDMWDRDVDRAVARTQTRPLAAGDVTMHQAWAFLALQLTTGLGVLVSLPHTWYCFQWGAASLPLVAIYPTTKRFFPYPQLVLGFTMNWGAWMGWAATYGSIDYSIIAPLYLSGVSWTLLYDTIYAHQDKQDDSKLGLQSTALTFGSDDDQQRNILHGLALLTASQWALVGWQADLSPVYYAGAAAAYGHLAWQVQTADFHNPHNVMARFRSNSGVGALMFASLAAGRYLV
eukprot:CAMPEP_0172473294 /NCGR_PEP_ID=MMETSP1065-20121228/68781_1 /TAXON_ID=265537 /ORGANISM="Amphiprora paludosa, Strain CCMP125" /LENGTH=413 /DNA_ID=CAMNT_0013231465 /DNA_START=407 /DNA_END=1648 /DNA_ORIENTATION=-